MLKLMLAAGAGSRRKLAELIRTGKVRVNGIVVEDFSHQINLRKDIVTIEGRGIDLKPHKLITVMLNKPAGILSTTDDDRGRKTVIDMLPARYRNKGLYPAGRLDMGSTGLLLLTNDGELTYKLTHPKYEHEKEYLIHIDGSLKVEDKKQLETGVMLEDGITHHARIRNIKSSPPFNYSITIHEGRKRQVRRMFAELGYFIFALRRIRIGNLSLGNLQEGKIRELSSVDIKKLFSGARS